MIIIFTMANLKSSKKDVRRTLKRTKANSAQKSKVRTYLKKAKEVVSNAQTYKEGMSAVVAYESVGMKATKHNLFNKKSIARHVRALVQALKSRFKKEEQIA